MTASSTDGTHNEVRMIDYPMHSLGSVDQRLRFVVKRLVATFVALGGPFRRRSIVVRQKSGERQMCWRPVQQMVWLLRDCDKYIQPTANNMTARYILSRRAIPVGVGFHDQHVPGTRAI